MGCFSFSFCLEWHHSAQKGACTLHSILCHVKVVIVIVIIIIIITITIIIAIIIIIIIVVVIICVVVIVVLLLLLLLLLLVIVIILFTYVSGQLYLVQQVIMSAGHAVSANQLYKLHHLCTCVSGQTLARCILSNCWDCVLDVLSVLLEGKSSCGITFSLGLLLGTEGAREETQRGRDAICLSLSGLQTASRLCCMLGKLLVCLYWCM